MVRFAGIGILTHALERALSRVDFNAQQLAKLSPAFAADWDAMARVFAAERCFGSDVFNLMHEDCAQAAGFTSVALCRLYRVAGLLDLEHAAYLDALNVLQQACRLPPTERLAATQAAQRELENRMRYRPMARSLTEVFAKSIEHDVRYLTSLEAAQTALAIERFRLEHGAWPPDLAALGRPLPVDPFTGQLFRYKPSSDGYMLYSPGADGVDDGGDEKRDIMLGVRRSPAAT